MASSSPFIPLSSSPPVSGGSVQIALKQKNSAAHQQSRWSTGFLAFAVLLSLCGFGLSIPDGGIFDGPCLSYLLVGIGLAFDLYTESRFSAVSLTAATVANCLLAMFFANYFSGVGVDLGTVSSLNEAVFILEALVFFFTLFGYSLCRWHKKPDGRQNRSTVI